MTRSADGRVTVRATRVSGDMKVDGRLDEAAYLDVPPITEFIQQEPLGAPVTEKTEAWVLFDDDEHLHLLPMLGRSTPSASSRTTCAATART